MGKTGKSAVLCAIFSFGLASSTLAPAAAAANAPASAALTKEEGGKVANPKIVPGDVVSITVYPAEEYNREVTVQPDGKVELALIGALTIKDLTTKQLEQLLEVRYSRYVDNPRITVNVRHFAGRRVAIIGEIRSPGFYEYRDGMKLLELVSQAGGLNDNARATRVGLLREGEAEGRRFNFQAVLDGHLDRDLALQPGDTIYVPKTTLNKKATWMTGNVLPWLTLASLVASLVLLAKQ